MDDLTALERAMIDAARRGVWVKPTDKLKVEELVDTGDPGLRVRAALVRELLATVSWTPAGCVSIPCAWSGS